MTINAKQSYFPETRQRLRQALLTFWPGHAYEPLRIHGQAHCESATVANLSHYIRHPVTPQSMAHELQ